MKEYYGLIYRYESPSGKSYIGLTTDELNRKRQHRQSAYNEKDKSYNSLVELEREAPNKDKN